MLLVKVLILDYSLLKSQHIPGTTITESHGDFIFRASRVLANFNESFGGFLALSFTSILLQANAPWVNISICSYVFARCIYAYSYYANAQKLRSIAFGISLIALVILVFVNGVALVALNRVAGSL